MSLFSMFQQMEQRRRDRHARAGHGDFLSDSNHPARRLFAQMEQREHEQNARAGHGDFLSDPNHPTRRLFAQIEQREREQNARAGHGDFLSDPNHPTRRLFAQIEQREREQNARAGHGDFLSDPNHPTRRLFQQMQQSDPNDDFLNNPMHSIRRGLAAMHRGAPRGGVPNPQAAPENHHAHAHHQHPPANPLAPTTEQEYGDCTICLEPLQSGESCRRPPCLHKFHDACICLWSQRSSKCPLCNLDWKSSPTTLRYRLQEVASLRASELRYVANYLEVDIQGAIERVDLESAVLASPHVHLVSCRRELLSESIGKLKQLVKLFNARQASCIVEKSELVHAIMSSSRFKQEHVDIESIAAATAPIVGHTTTSTRMKRAAQDLETALEESVRDADARAVAVNGPLSSAILHSRLVPDLIVVLEVDRTFSALRNALLAGDELANVRDDLENHGHQVELPSGAKVFVRPDQYERVISSIEEMEVKPRHIFVSQEFETAVTGVIAKIKRTSVKRRRITTTRPSFCVWRSMQINVEIKRTFIHLDIPSSLLSGPSSRHAASA
eukprot:TRINITY_DN2859_c0_g1_i5.p1 TRINITY_DN2859_c0_g1~~TRINITY_DN2859_c0_g1_i5.p1  ORF type:complete len:556 (-),score=51.13 TRINITY_DN2859_c0_g1_i5:175-1842(-)